MKIRIPTLLIACGGMALSPLTAQDAPKPDVTVKPALPTGKEEAPEKKKADKPAEEKKKKEKPEGKEQPKPEKKMHGRPDGHPAKTAPQKPTTYLGLMLEGVPPPVAAQVGIPEGFGLLVADVAPDSPAKAADLQKYDVVTLIGDQRVVNLPQFQALIRSQKKGDSVTLTISRKGQEQKVTAVLGERMLPAGPPEGMHPPMHFGHGHHPMPFHHGKHFGMRHDDPRQRPHGHHEHRAHGRKGERGHPDKRHHATHGRPDSGPRQGPPSGPCPKCEGAKDPHAKHGRGPDEHAKRGPGPDDHAMRGRGPDEHAKRGPGPDGDHRQMDRNGPPPPRRDGPDARGPDGPNRGGPGPEARRGDGPRPSPSPEGAPRGPEPRRDGDRGPGPDAPRDGNGRPNDGPPPGPSRTRA